MLLKENKILMKIKLGIIISQSFISVMFYISYISIHTFYTGMGMNKSGYSLVYKISTIPSIYVVKMVLNESSQLHYYSVLLNCTIFFTALFYTFYRLNLEIGFKKLILCNLCVYFILSCLVEVISRF
jgi:hypothetical protein